MRSSDEKRDGFAYIPNLGQYKPEREGFIFNEKENQHECIQEGSNKAILLYNSKGYEKKSYRSSESLSYCKRHCINAFIPNFGQYKAEREGFIFNTIENRYECVKEGENNVFLPFKKEATDSKGYTKNIYRSSEKDCKDCALRAECCGKITKFKKLDYSIHKLLYDAMHRKLNQNKNYTRFLTKRRSSTVDLVLGTLINHHNMKRINARGMKAANKHVLMAALSYNLKKLLKFSLHKSKKAQIMNLPKGKFWLLPNLQDTTVITLN